MPSQSITITHYTITTTLDLPLITTEMLSPNPSSSLKGRDQGSFLLIRECLGEETLASLMALPCMYKHHINLTSILTIFTVFGCLFWLQYAMQVDLVGGYYDAGDNVKFGFPMAFTTTMLSWSVIEFGGLMKGELQNAREAIRWATDYLLKATAHPDTIYVQVSFLLLKCLSFFFSVCVKIWFCLWEKNGGNEIGGFGLGL